MRFGREQRIKRSVDLSQDTDGYLDHFRDLAARKSPPLSRGAALDIVAKATLSLTPDEAAEISHAVSKVLRAAQERLEGISSTNEYTYSEANASVERLTDFVELLDILSDGRRAPAPMRRIDMRGKRLYIPDSDDWYVLNDQHAAISDEATIVEVKDGSRFGIPHFVYFDNGETATNLIDEKILDVFPEYREVLARQVKPLYDADGNFLNANEYARSPIRGYFHPLPLNALMGNPYGVHIEELAGGEEVVE